MPLWIFLTLRRKQSPWRRALTIEKHVICASLARRPWRGPSLPWPLLEAHVVRPDSPLTRYNAYFSTLDSNPYMARARLPSEWRAGGRIKRRVPHHPRADEPREPYRGAREAHHTLSQLSAT
ncbi:Hypothetical predicted protein [Cloeon dipterum]|uniref:Uncharacterized protein n=1 Tax=Cloeon dipterum TaxID=197152 RepID=A0A8S1CXM6_9INSE|nr:Hypothetical predicted protein [Cloeon dipterum]